MIEPLDKLIRIATGRRFVRFGLTSGLSFMINLGLTALLHEVVALSEEWAFAISLASVFLMNFLLLRHYVFDASSGDPRRQIALTAISSATFRGMEYLGFLLVHTMMSVHYLLAVGLVLGVSFLLKFFYYGNVVFANRGHGAASRSTGR